jgi:hypothetical protein
MVRFGYGMKRHVVIGEGLKPGQVFSSTFIGITFERNEIFPLDIGFKMEIHLFDRHLI